MTRKSIDIYGNRHPKRGALVANPIPPENVFWYDIFQPIVDAINKLYTGASKPYKSGDGIYLKADGTINLTRELFSTINGNSILQGAKDIKIEAELPNLKTINGESIIGEGDIQIELPEGILTQGDNNLFQNVKFISVKSQDEETDQFGDLTIKKDFSEIEQYIYKDGYSKNFIGKDNVYFIKDSNQIDGANAPSDGTIYKQGKKDIELGSTNGKINIHSYSSMSLESENNKISITSKGITVNETGDIKIIASGRKFELDNKTTNLSSSTGFNITTKEIKFIDDAGQVIAGGKNDIFYVKKRFEVEEPNRQNSMKLYTDGFEVLAYNSDKSVSNRITFSPSKNGFNMKRGELNEDVYEEINIFKIDDNGDVYIRKNGDTIKLQDNLGRETIRIHDEDISLSTGFHLGLNSAYTQGYELCIIDQQNYSVVDTLDLPFKTINGNSIIGTGNINISANLSPFITHSYDEDSYYEKTDYKTYGSNYLIRDNHENVRYYGKTGNPIIKSGVTNLEFNNNDGTKFVQFTDDEIKVYKELNFITNNSVRYGAINYNNIHFKYDSNNVFEIDDSGITIGHYKQSDTYLEFKKDGEFSSSDVRDYFRLVSDGEQILKVGYDQRYAFGINRVLTINHPNYSFTEGVMIHAVLDYIGIGMYDNIVSGDTNADSRYLIYLRDDGYIHLKGRSDIDIDSNSNITIQSSGDMTISSDSILTIAGLDADMMIKVGNYQDTRRRVLQLENDCLVNNYSTTSHLHINATEYSNNEYTSKFKFGHHNSTFQNEKDFIIEVIGTDSAKLYNSVSDAYISFNSLNLTIFADDTINIGDSSNTEYVNIYAYDGIDIVSEDISLKDPNLYSEIAIKYDTGPYGILLKASHPTDTSYNNITLTIGSTTLTLDETKLQRLAALLA